MPLVTPTPIPAYPPAPLPTDDRVTFSTKAFALSGSYEPQRIIFNTVAGEVYTNALWSQTKAGESAASASQAAASASNAANSVTAVNQTVADILAAKDAIQAGPVASVMGRTGVVTGLVEAVGGVYSKATAMSAAPLGQWVIFADAAGGGVDWPLTDAACWNVFTIGTTTRKTQRATQVLAGSLQGWTFERQMQDGVWSAWSRVFTANSLFESVSDVRSVSGTLNLDPRVATVNYRYIVGNTNFVLPPAIPGAQLVLVLGASAAHSYSFSANVRPPVSGLPALVGLQSITLTLIAPLGDGTDLWHLHVGSRHSLL